MHCLHDKRRQSYLYVGQYWDEILQKNWSFSMLQNDHFDPNIFVMLVFQCKYFQYKSNMAVRLRFPIINISYVKIYLTDISTSLKIFSMIAILEQYWIKI